MSINQTSNLRNLGYSNAENTVDLPRHRWYYYKEGFSPFLVEKAIESGDIKKDDLIIDPFNGSGTTSLTASINGYNSLGIEVNPFTAFLSQVKNENTTVSNLERHKEDVVGGIKTGFKSNLVGFSTFSQTLTNKKWLFNNNVLSAFEGGWQVAVNQISNPGLKSLYKLSLLSSAMTNCNARKDGKCLRYRPNWEQKNFDENSFLKSFEENLDRLSNDIETTVIDKKPKILNGDCRTILEKSHDFKKFKLCITSPPYLNTFDYTDIYRPELFLGKFVNSPKELYDLRLQTVRSHIQAKWALPQVTDFGLLYTETINHIIKNQDSLMHKSIPIMVQAYFEDMFNILCLLKKRADTDAQIWLVVSNSAYANKEIPVDLIIGDIGTKAGWFLREISVLREIKRRKTKHSPDITHLRESVIIFSSNRAKNSLKS
ncbi:site-specific DNA-methyltransferase [Chryseobacterium sp. SN22]|uniref:DNA methyltransferase n=1 Tax=Chryseobacterium sp. SN22 TaxID=2606431 RepID=UPI0011ECF56B|nr:DNA methyltransferase [Chryseobacterium sp. SN22]KAA0126685.1 site-specific DNA-methyltransferase [Chryseobacterium sp. SN22]